MTAHAHIAGRVTAYPRKTDCGVDGIYAQRSTETSRSSPVAAQRCAEGAGLDGGDLGRSTIICAVHHTRRNSTDDDLPMNVFATSRIYTSLTGTTFAEIRLFKRLPARDLDGARCDRLLGPVTWKQPLFWASRLPVGP
jgi:hypothetical protein